LIESSICFMRPSVSWIFDSWDILYVDCKVIDYLGNSY
jgi:hypothetical protein